jgi:hypothetical protein
MWLGMLGVIASPDFDVIGIVACDSVILDRISCVARTLNKKKFFFDLF